VNSRVINNSVAVRQAVQMRQRSGQVVRQNMMMMQRHQLSRLVQAVVATPATLEDYQELAEIVQEAQQQDLVLDQLGSRIQEGTPFAGLVRLLPENKDQAYNFVNVLLAAIAIIIAIVFGQRGAASDPPPAPTLTPTQVEEIIERVEEHIDQNRQLEPPPSTHPGCDQDSDKSAR
jgi:hypothetical protein